MNSVLRRFALASLVGVLGAQTLSAVAEEAYYRWQDERGNLVHSDRPPPKGVDYEVVSTGSTFKRVVDEAEGAVPLEVTPEVGNEFEPVDTARATIPKNPEYCDRARVNLDNLDNYARIRVRGSDGEYRYLDEQEKAEQRKQAEQAIEDYCE